MNRLLWPGIVFVLVGSLVALHAVTLAFASTTGAPRVVQPDAAAARPRPGWQVELSVTPAEGGDAVIQVRLADASGRTIDDATVAVAAGPLNVALAPAGAGLYRATAPLMPGGPGTARVLVERHGSTWTFDRPAAVEAAP